MATLGVQFAQSLAAALALASLTLVAGLVLVRVVRAWAESAGVGRAVRVALEPAFAVAGEGESALRPLAGVSARAPSRAPPTTIDATWRRVPFQALRRAE